MSHIYQELSLEQIAALVSTTLQSAKIQAVLSGGSVVSIYSENAYQSKDLDFVTMANLRQITQVMSTLNFSRQSGRHFEHPNCEYGPFKDEVQHHLTGTHRILLRVSYSQVIFAVDY